MSQRRLAAIMFSDIVGYTALMGSDEDKAFQVLRQNRNIQQSLINKYNGKWLKEMGDGILAQFGSATDSVQCAIEIQRQAKKELDTQIRIGIHLGDVTFENEDVFGDGVNIASRLQSIADPGGIYISESIQNAIRSQKDIKSQYIGEVKLKNVNYPFKTYFIKEKGLPVPKKQRIDELTGTKKTESVLVLPFDNYTGSDELEYFVAGMHASLIGAIGKVSGMRVISKTTANAFRNTEKSIPEIASELGVDKVIEASILGLGEKISLQVKLLDAYPEEKQLWMQDYMEDKNQILNLYNKVTKEISDEIGIVLTSNEERLLGKSDTVDKEAYDSYLRSHQYWDDLSQESLNKALEYLNMAIEKDPDFAPSYAGLAEVWVALAQMGFEIPEVAGPKIFEYLDKAIKLDPDFPGSHYTKAIIAVWTEWNWEKGEREFLKALEINPNDVMSRIYYSHLLFILKRYDEAYFHSQMAAELDPMNPLILGLSAMLDESSRTSQALEKCKKALKIDPEHYFALLAYAEATYFNGDYKCSLETDLRTWPGLNDAAREDIMAVYHDKGYVEAIRILLSYAEENAKINNAGYFEMGEFYWKAGNLDKSIECFVKAYELHDPMMPYITLSEIGFEDIKDDPRIISIIEKMKFPLP